MYNIHYCNVKSKEAIEISFQVCFSVYVIQGSPERTKLTILVSSYWKKNFIRNNAHGFFNLSLVFFKLLIENVAFFLGHPV